MTATAIGRQNHPIEAWDLDGVVFKPSLREISVGGQVHRLPPKPAAVLEVLLEAAPEPVSKEDLLDRVWPRQVVGDSVVSDAIKALRRACERPAGALIETLHKHGYRLTVVPQPASTAPSRKRFDSRLLRRAAWAVPASALLVGALVVAGSGSEPTAQAAQASQTAPANPKPAHPHLSTADVLYARGVQHYARYRPSDNRTAIEMFEKALDQDPNHVRAWSGLANAYAMQAHKYGKGREWVERGIEFARQAIALDSNDPTGYKALGTALSYLGRREEAAQAYEQALARYNPYPAAQVNLGSIRISQGRVIEGIRHLETALHYAPGGVITRLQLGHAYRILGMDDLARAWYESGWQMAPGGPADRSAVLPFLLTRGEVAQVDEHLTTMGEGFADDPHLLFWCGMSALYQGQPEWAQTHFLAAANHTSEASSLWLDARLRAAVSALLSGEAGDDALLDQLEQRIEERIAVGSDAAVEHLRLALVAAARGQDIQLSESLSNAIDLGWLLIDELRQDPAWAPLRATVRDDLAARMEDRQQQLITLLTQPPTTLAAN